jgi:hypothetical protein
LKITDLSSNLDSPTIDMEAPAALLSPLSSFMTEYSRMSSVGTSGIDCRFNEDECDESFTGEDDMFVSTGEIGKFDEDK